MTNGNRKPAQRPRPAGGAARLHGDAEIRGMLQSGEELIRVATIHNAVYWKGAAVLILGILLMLLVFNLGVFIAFVGLILLCIAYLKKYYLLLVLTSKRVIIRYGITQLEAVQLHHNRIESVELSWTILGRMLGYAMVFITGTGSRVSVVPFVADAQAFRNDLDKILYDRDEIALKQQGTPAPAAEPVSPSSPEK